MQKVYNDFLYDRVGMLNLEMAELRVELVGGVTTHHIGRDASTREGITAKRRRREEELVLGESH